MCYIPLKEDVLIIYLNEFQILSLGLLHVTLGTSGGATYIRWGRTVCPNETGTELVYNGIAAGSLYRDDGGGANYICMANREDVEYQDEATTANLSIATVYAAEYRMRNGQALDHVRDYSVHCAVCAVSSRSAQVMIPGRLTCPDTWTVEYNGWLVADHNNHNRAMFICLDKTPETTIKTSISIQGAIMHHVEAACSITGLPCPPFDGTKELACVVCTK